VKLPAPALAFLEGELKEIIIPNTKIIVDF
jgi:hypothetical protein